MPGKPKSARVRGVISPSQVPGEDREDREGERGSAEEPAPAAPAVAPLASAELDDGAAPASRDHSTRDAVPAIGVAAAGAPPADGPPDGGPPFESPLLDRRAFDRAIAQHLQALRSRAAQLCRGYGDPDDLVQDALLRAFRARSQTRDLGRLRGWLLTIVTNTFLDSLRRRKARPGEVELEIDVPAPALEDDDSPWSSIELDDIRAAVAELPDDVREAYRLFALEDNDYNAVSKQLGIPKATVGTRILRARKRLRALLQPKLQ